MRLIKCMTLVNIEGEVYKLSSKDYDWFKNQVYTRNQINTFDWSDLLHWVKEHGKLICIVETYNF